MEPLASATTLWPGPLTASPLPPAGYHGGAELASRQAAAAANPHLSLYGELIDSVEHFPNPETMTLEGVALNPHERLRAWSSLRGCARFIGGRGHIFIMGGMVSRREQ